MVATFFAMTLLWIASAASAERSWTLTTADFKQHGVDLVSLDEQAATVATDASSQQRIPLGQLLQLERSTSTDATPSKYTVYLSSGDRLTGEPLSAKDEQLQWRGDSVGEISLSMRQLRALLKSGQTPMGLDELRSEDQVHLANGDVMKGIVTSIDAGKVNVQVGSESTSVPLETITSIYFASAGQSKADAKRAFRVRLSDGSTLLATSVKWSTATATLTLPDKTQRPVDSSRIQLIEQINGPVSWLSARDAIENIQTPFFGQSSPARMDRNVRGEPIRFGDRVYSRGIGVHSYSKITYALDPGWKAFRTQYAIDGDLPYADVTVRILLDGKVAHEKQNFKAGILSPVVLIDLNGAKTLSLEVDYGSGYDTQDRLNWIEPALLKNKPELPKPAPVATAPASQTAP